MAITAEQVKILRERTQAGMMDCKKALTHTDGDIEAAIDYLKKQGQIKASKKADRVTKCGRIGIAHDDHAVVMVEVNCETDFVDSSENFKVFTDMVAQVALRSEADNIESLQSAAFDDESTVEQAKNHLIAKVGENIQLRHIKRLPIKGNVFTYSHGSHIAAVVDLSVDDAALGRDIAMHITAMAPVALDASGIPAEVIAREEVIVREKAKSAGNPEAMLKGSMKKFVNEMTLVGQFFVKEPKQTIAQLLSQHQAEVFQFHRIEVGEGIEVAAVDFAEEVRAQIEGGQS